MDLSFVTATSLGELTNAKSKRQIRQHASKEMWKVRKRDHTDSDKTLALRIPRKPARRPHEQSSQQIIVYPQSTRRLITGDSRLHLGLMTSVSSISDDSDDHPDIQSESPEFMRRALLNPPVSRLGAGRLDPFTHYPVEIDLPEQRILHHGEPSTAHSPYFLINTTLTRTSPLTWHSYACVLESVCLSRALICRTLRGYPRNALPARCSSLSLQFF